jgi:hypothetical protein
MGLNPYFNESRSNLDYQEVKSRVDNDTNVYERSVARYYALVNASSIGKPTVFSQRSVIFEASHPSQQHLPKWVDPKAGRWTSVHRTNEAIVGTDNVEGATLNYNHWHQGVGLQSASDERFMAELRGLQHTQRIENLKELDAGAKVPDWRKYRNLKSAEAIIRKLRQLRDDLGSQTYLPRDDANPTPEQKENVEQFKADVQAVISAYSGFTYDNQEETDAVTGAIMDVARVNPTNSNNTKWVLSSLTQLSQLVKKGVNKVFGNKDPQTKATIEVNPVVPPAAPAAPAAPDAAAQAAVAAATGAPVPAEAPQAVQDASVDPFLPPSDAAAASAAAPAEPSENVADASTTELPVSPIEGVQGVVEEETADPFLPEKVPTLNPEENNTYLGRPAASKGDILHFTGEQISKMPFNLFGATRSELVAMSGDQFKGFEKRLNDMRNAGQMKPYMLSPDWYKFFDTVRNAHMEDGYTHEGLDYYDEDVKSQAMHSVMGPAVALNERAYIKDKAEGKGGMPPRRKSMTTQTPAQTIDAGVGAEPQPPAMDPNVQIIANTLDSVPSRASPAANRKIAERTIKVLEKLEQRAARDVPMTQPQRSTSATVGDRKGVMGAAAGAAAAIAAIANTGPSEQDLRMTQSALKPLVTAVSALGHPAMALGLGAFGSMYGPQFFKQARDQLGWWNVQKFCEFIVGPGKSCTSGLFKGIIHLFFETKEETHARLGESMSNATLQAAVNEGMLEAAKTMAPMVRDVVRQQQEADIAKRFSISPAPTTQGARDGEVAPAKSLYDRVFGKVVLEPVVRSEPQVNKIEEDKVGGKRHERGDFTKAERRAQKRIKRTAEEAAEELKSDSDGMEEMGAVPSSTTDVLASMHGFKKRNDHRVPTGWGIQMPLIQARGGMYGGGNSNIADDEADIIANAFVWGLVQCRDYTERGIPFDEEQLGRDSFEKTLEERFMNSSEQRVVLPPMEAAAMPHQERDFLEYPTEAPNKPEESEPIQPVDDANAQLKAIDQLTREEEAQKANSADAKAADAAGDEANPPPPDADAPPAEGDAQGGGFFSSLKNVAQKAVGAVTTAAKAATDPNGAIRTTILPALAAGSTVATAFIPALAPVAAGLNAAERVNKAASLAGYGGEKPKRKPSEWSLLVKQVYHEMKATNPEVTIAMAAKEASMRRKSGSLPVVAT